MRWINHYPADGVSCFVNTYLLDSDLSGGQHYPAFEHHRPVGQELQVHVTDRQSLITGQAKFTHGYPADCGETDIFWLDRLYYHQ